MGRLGSDKFSKEFGKIISLNSFYRPWIFIILLLFLFILPMSVIEYTSKFSICQIAIGEHCPSTGITRGVASLLKGDFSGAMNYNKISILVLLIMLSTIVYDLIKRSKNF